MIGRRYKYKRKSKNVRKMEELKVRITNMKILKQKNLNKEMKYRMKMKAHLKENEVVEGFQTQSIEMEKRGRLKGTIKTVMET